MKAEEAYALSRKYTENTVAGAGAVAGKPCQIQSITDITGGHRITFLWKDNSNVDHTSVMDVMDGKGIKAVAVNSSNHLIITYDDDTIVDAGEIDIHSAVNSVNGKTGNVDLTASDVGALSDSTYEEEIHGVNLFDDSKIEVGTAWNGDTNVNRARNIIPCEPNKEYVVSMNGANNLDNVFFALSASIPPSSQTAITSFPYTIRTGASDKYITLGFNKTNIALSDVTALKIMLRKSDIKDPAYRPYNYQAIQNQLNAQGVLGAKNLLKYPYHHVSGIETPVGGSITYLGVTYTVNDDYSITANGTATGSSYFIFNRKQDWNDCDLYGKKIKIIVKPVVRDTFVQLYDTDNSKTLFRTDASSGAVEFTFPDSLKNNVSWNISLNVLNRNTVSNVIFKTMITLASDPDDTYQPYAMTNRELTEKKIDAELTFVTGVSIDTLTENKRYYCSRGMTGLPTGNTGYLDVHRASGGVGIHQTFYPAGVQGEIYVRRFWDNAWGSWYKFTGTVVS